MPRDRPARVCKDESPDFDRCRVVNAKLLWCPRQVAQAGGKGTPRRIETTASCAYRSVAGSACACRSRPPRSSPRSARSPSRFARRIQSAFPHSILRRSPGSFVPNRKTHARGLCPTSLSRPKQCRLPDRCVARRVRFFRVCLPCLHCRGRAELSLVFHQVIGPDVSSDAANTNSVLCPEWIPAVLAGSARGPCATSAGAPRVLPTAPAARLHTSLRLGPFPYRSCVATVLRADGSHPPKLLSRPTPRAPALRPCRVPERPVFDSLHCVSRRAGLVSEWVGIESARRLRHRMFVYSRRQCVGRPLETTLVDHSRPGNPARAFQGANAWVARYGRCWSTVVFCTSLSSAPGSCVTAELRATLVDQAFSAQPETGRPRRPIRRPCGARIGAKVPTILRLANFGSDQGRPFKPRPWTPVDSKGFSSGSRVCQSVNPYETPTLVGPSESTAYGGRRVTSDLGRAIPDLGRVIPDLGRPQPL